MFATKFLLEVFLRVMIIQMTQHCDSNKVFITM